MASGNADGQDDAPIEIRYTPAPAQGEPRYSLGQLNLLPNETFFGQIQSLNDAYVLYSAVVEHGLLPLLRRRLHPDELKLIRSGSVYLYDEEESGIQRWTDRIAWGPSKIVGHFLEYREVVAKVSARAKKKLVDDFLAKNGANFVKEDQADIPMAESSAAAAARLQPSSQVDQAMGVLKTSPSGAMMDYDLTPIKTEMDVRLDGVGAAPIASNASREVTYAVINSLPVHKRAQVSSVLDSKYKGVFVFKKNGLVKRSITLTLDQQGNSQRTNSQGSSQRRGASGRYHAVCYFHVMDLQWLATLSDFKETAQMAPSAGVSSVVSKWKSSTKAENEDLQNSQGRILLAANHSPQLET